MKHFDSARHDVEEAIRVLQDGTDPSHRRYLGNAYLHLGYVRAAQGAPGDAHAAWTNAASLLRPAALDKADARELDHWARVLIALKQREEAAAVVARLRSIGYRPTDFVSLASAEGY
jgi:hypothetical protein